jgi:hypothetical protein
MVGSEMAPNERRRLSKARGMRLLLLSFFVLGVFSGSADEAKPLNFREVFGIVRSNLTDVSEAELSQTAAFGFIKELGTKVQLVGTNQAASPDADAEPISRKSIYAGDCGYIRIGTVDSRLSAPFQKAVQEWMTNRGIKGLVLDLRYANGTDYEAAAKSANLFVKRGEPVLKYGDREIRATEGSKAVQWPLAVLVNKETSGAAEALAAVVRESSAGVIIGSPTAGEARVFEEFTLSTGQKLRVGKIPVEVGDGKVIPAQGVSPDIQISVRPADEKIFFQDPFRVLPQIAAEAGSTNFFGGTGRIRNEAELVRRHRDGEFQTEGKNGTQGEKPVVMDPALARALDFLKGVSVLQQHRPL